MQPSPYQMTKLCLGLPESCLNYFPTEIKCSRPIYKPRLMAHELTLPRKSNGNFIPRLLFKGVYQINELWLMNRNLVETTGVDLSKILGGQTKILGGKRWQKVINAWAFLDYWGHVPGLPPRSTPMEETMCID